jgi:excisionase family DNA binding protein
MKNRNNGEPIRRIDLGVGQLNRRFLCLRECAERTGTKESTWRAWVLLRKVPYHKIGRSVRVLESDLEQMIADSRIAARESRNDRP